MGIFKNFKDNLKKAKADFDKDLEDYRKEKAEKEKHKKKWHSFECEVKGHFVHERQRVLFKIFKDNYNKEIEHDETQAYNCLEFVDEPENEYDPNAIAIYARGYGQIGYVPKNQTKELKETIHLDQDYKSYLTIYKSDKEYFAELQLLQKYWKINKKIEDV